MKPIAVAPGQTRHLQRQNNPHLAQSRLGHHLLKSQSILACRRRLSEILIDQDDAFPRPAEFNRPLHKIPLPLLALLVVDHLMLGRLTNVDISLPRPVEGRDIFSVHETSPWLSSRPFSDLKKPVPSRPGVKVSLGVWGDQDDSRRFRPSPPLSIRKEEVARSSWPPTTESRERLWKTGEPETRTSKRSARPRKALGVARVPARILWTGRFSRGWSVHEEGSEIPEPSLSWAIQQVSSAPRRGQMTSSVWPKSGCGGWMIRIFSGRS